MVKGNWYLFQSTPFFLHTGIAGKYKKRRKTHEEVRKVSGAPSRNADGILADGSMRRR